MVLILFDCFINCITYIKSTNLDLYQYCPFVPVKLIIVKKSLKKYMPRAHFQVNQDKTTQGREVDRCKINSREIDPMRLIGHFVDSREIDRPPCR